MDSQRTRALITLLKAIVGVLAAFGVISIGAGNPAGVATDTKTTTIQVPVAPPAVAIDGPDADTKRDDALRLDSDAQDQVERLDQQAGGDAAEGDLRGNDPTKVGLPDDLPLAAQEWPGCRDAFVRNSSQRTAPVSRITWHETVSRENGLSSQNALTARANDPRTQVSWHFLIARKSGLCTYTVPTSLKAWHVGNGNSVSVGIEVEADGSEPSYVEGAGKDKLFAVTRRIAAIYHIPLRHGSIQFDGNCNPIGGKSGILEHRDYGLCGGGHLDVCSSALCHSGGPESAELASWRIDPLIRELAGGDCNARCHRVKELRGKHRRTHARFRARDCRHKHKPENGYCQRLRNRNAAVHTAAKREHISLKGTYR